MCVALRCYKQWIRYERHPPLREFFASRSAKTQHISEKRKVKSEKKYLTGGFTKIHSRIWWNPQQDLAKSTRGFHKRDTSFSRKGRVVIAKGTRPYRKRDVSLFSLSASDWNTVAWKFAKSSLQNRQVDASQALARRQSSWRSTL